MVMKTQPLRLTRKNTGIILNCLFRGYFKNDLIDLYDAIEVVKYIMKIRTFTETDKQFADFTGNDAVDLYDAIEIARTLI